MRFWTAYAFFALGIAAKAYGAGDGHHGSVSDLIAPAVNVSILAGFLIWKLKGPLKAYFDKMSVDISNTLERANLKSREAELMLQNEQNKATNLANEITKINQQTESDIVLFEKNLSKEIEEKSQKLKVDANSKVQADKKAALDELNAELLNQVILKTKSTIKTNKDYQTKVSSKLLQGL